MTPDQTPCDCSCPKTRALTLTRAPPQPKNPSQMLHSRTAPLFWGGGGWSSVCGKDTGDRLYNHFKKRYITKENQYFVRLKESPPPLKASDAATGAFRSSASHPSFLWDTQLIDSCAPLRSGHMATRGGDPEQKALINTFTGDRNGSAEKGVRVSF